MCGERPRIHLLGTSVNKGKKMKGAHPHGGVKGRGRMPPRPCSSSVPLGCLVVTAHYHGLAALAFRVPGVVGRVGGVVLVLPDYAAVATAAPTASSVLLVEVCNVYHVPTTWTAVAHVHV